MKPALLYLRKYIEENYQHNKVQRDDDKENTVQLNKKCSEEVIFKERKAHQWQNSRVKEFYFRPNTSLKSKKMHKLKPQNSNTESELKELRIEPTSKKITTNPSEVDPKKQSNTIVSGTGQNITPSVIQTPENQNADQKRDEVKSVRFIISPPLQNTPQFGKTAKLLHSSKQIPKQSEGLEQAGLKPDPVIQQAPKDELNQIINAPNQPQQTPQFTKSEHFKISSKSMRKIGYDTLCEYLNEMKKLEKIQKKQVKEACYYPLACMAPKINEAQECEMIAKKQKAIFQEKLSKFQQEITVHDYFSSKTVEIKNFHISKSLSKAKSNFSKGQNFHQQKPLTDETLEKKSKKFLLEYEQVLVCNCANKKYFTYNLSPKTDYNSFFKYTTPLLDSRPQKENNYLISNQEEEAMGLYFCCLINASLGVREGFFWVGKPIQYYRKDKLIKVIDDFSFDVKAFGLFESDRLWIVDYHGRNSHIMKSLLTKCVEQAISQETNNPLKPKSRIIKKISLSMSQPPKTQTPEMYMSLLANFSEFNETIIFKKQRNNISTRDPFKLIYEPSENHCEKKKINYQQTF